jgi:hydrophobic/amphiphilic exporter-1 (mainly G- bacteria), HAE1 family
MSIRSNFSKGMSLFEAILEPDVTQLRPILMISITMITGIISIALRIEAGSEEYGGDAIMGGSIAPTLLNLVVVPLIFTYRG